MRIREGLVSLELPPQGRVNIPGGAPAFYNPHMHPNRDLSVLMMKYLAALRGAPFQAVETHAATGITSLRWHKEAPEAVTRTFSSDISTESIAVFQRNYALNAIDEKAYVIEETDGRKLLEKLRKEPIHFIEVDPFGIAIPYVEEALVTLDNQGILSLTNTNLSPLAGSYVNACRRRYTAVPLKNEFKHEIGLRIFIKKVIERGAEHDVAMVPVLAVAHQHFYKVFFRKVRGARRANELIGQIGFLLYCPNCLNRRTILHVNQSAARCEVCRHGFHYAGPLWLGPLVEDGVLEALQRIAAGMETLSPVTRRLLRMLEGDRDVPSVGYYQVPRLMKKWGLKEQPPIRKILRWTEGVRTHFAGDGFRTPLSHAELIERLSARLPVRINVLEPAPWEADDGGA